MKIRESGFTLIELMVVTTLVVMVSSVSIVALARYRDRRVVQIDALALSEHLKKVQVRASAVDVPAGCTGVANYTVNLAGTDLTVDISCAVGSVSDVGDLRFSLVNSTFDSPATIVFDSRTVAASPTDIDICGNGQEYRVSVSALANVGTAIYQGTCP